MSKLTTIADAKHAVDMSCHYNAHSFEPITSDNGVLLGWTFATARAGAYGWILADGRVCHATEWTRDDAESCVQRSI